MEKQVIPFMESSTNAEFKNGIILVIHGILTDIQTKR